MQVPEYKIVLIGDTNTGKTTFLNKLVGNNKNAVQTLGVDVTPFDLHFNNDKIRINFWDCAGDQKFRGLGDGYYIGANGAIIFTDNGGLFRQFEKDLNKIDPNTPKLFINGFNTNDDLLEKYKQEIYNLVKS